MTPDYSLIHMAVSSQGIQDDLGEKSAICACVAMCQCSCVAGNVSELSTLFSCFSVHEADSLSGSYFYGNDRTFLTSY